MSFVSCVAWIKRGAAKSKPDKIKLSPEELREVIRSATCEPNAQDEDHDEDNDMENDASEDPVDEYNFSTYDVEEGDSGALLALENVAISNRDEDLPDFNDESDSEDEDEIIKETDNLIVVGSLEKDCDTLNVYVFNEKDNDFYVHHDIMVLSSPLCIEWLNYTSQTEPANFIAVGGMSPIIEVWDVDMINPVEPVCVLGYKAKKKKFAHRNHGHKDAVLDLSWNTHLPHILASSSVDKTILLWDLDTRKASTVLDNFTGNIETIEWHVKEGQTLLAGSADSSVKIFDCRYKDTFKEWKVDGEALIAKWNIWNPYYILVGTSSGCIYSFDCRTETPVWTINDNIGEVTGLAMSSAFPGLLTTCHLDGGIRIWDVRTDPINVASKVGSVGNIHAFSLNPDSNYIGCIGGSKKSKNLAFINLKSYNEVVQHWEQDIGQTSV